MAGNDVEKLVRGANQMLHAIWCGLLVIVVLQVLVGILANYVDYVPPNFKSFFLEDREQYFYGIYSIAFYAHLIASPITLTIGILLLNNRLRAKFPVVHRKIGKIQVMLICSLVVPSGLIMSFYAIGGWTSFLGFFTLSLLTFAFVFCGWRCAVRRQFESHRRWMSRGYVMLASAIVLRLIAMITTTLNWEPMLAYQCATWSSWLLPLAAFEVFDRIYRKAIVEPC